MALFRLSYLWLLALASSLAVAVAGILPAFAAAPSIDTTVPTPSYTAACALGVEADTVCLTDNSSVYYYMFDSGDYALEDADQDDVIAALKRYNATDLAMHYDGTPVYSGSAETDVIYQEGSFGLSAAYDGITWCNSHVEGSTHRCDQSYVRMRGNGLITEGLAGHESGHAFGEVHGPQASPVQGQCDADMGVMRASSGCRTAALGAVIVANLNWIY